MAKLDIEALRGQHREIMIRVTNLRGLGDIVQTRDDALEARSAIAAVDQMLTCHLQLEDDHLYPALMASDDQSLAAIASECAEEMGSILGAWEAYRDRWTTPLIVADMRRFQAATAGIIGALALRIEREDSELFPAAETLLAKPRASFCAVG